MKQTDWFRGLLYAEQIAENNPTNPTTAMEHEFNSHYFSDYHSQFDTGFIDYIRHHHTLKTQGLLH